MDETSMTGVANMQNRQARPLSPGPFRVPPLTCPHSMDLPKQPRANGISGELSILVRVGDQYQVTIPIMCVRRTKRRNKHGQENFPDTQAVSSVGFTDTEAQSFLLALYFFGKTFVEGRKFIENKEMGDIVFYYYGEFYRSDIRRSWLVCRKGKSRKCIHGRGIVTGWRRNELLSRLARMMFDRCSMWLTGDYPKCSPIIVDKLQLEASHESEVLAVKAQSIFHRSTRSLVQPFSLREIATMWDKCICKVITEYAEQNGGGSFSARYGVWKSCVPV